MRELDNFKITGILIITAMLLFGCSKKEKKHMRMPASHKTEKCDADFDVFFRKFSSDSVFQKLHVKFPLKNSHLDDDYHNMVREDIPLSKFTFIDFSKHKDAMMNEHDKFNVEIKKYKGSVFYFMNGYDNGIMTKIKFYFDGSCWKMIEIVDEST